MNSQKKGKAPASKFWKGIRAKGRFLFCKGKRFFSILALPLKSFKEKYRRWPRFLQVCSLYLLVLLFAGAIFVWRSAQLRTINPYIENIKFSEPESDYPLKENDKKQKEGGEKEGEKDRTGEAAAAGTGSGGEMPEDNSAEAAPKAVWPVSSRELIYSFNDYFKEILGYGQKYSACNWIRIKAKPGDEVHSILNGRVLRVKNTDKPSFAKEIIVEHEGGYKVYYGALEESKVKEGQQVVRGQEIATVRKNPEGKEKSFLHLEIKDKSGDYVDPESILP